MVAGFLQRANVEASRSSKCLDLMASFPPCSVGESRSWAVQIQGEGTNSAVSTHKYGSLGATKVKICPFSPRPLKIHFLPRAKYTHQPLGPPKISPHYSTRIEFELHNLRCRYEWDSSGYDNLWTKETSYLLPIGNGEAGKGQSQNIFPLNKEKLAVTQQPQIHRNSHIQLGTHRQFLSSHFLG